MSRLTLKKGKEEKMNKRKKMSKGKILLAAVVGSCVMAGSAFAGEWKASSGGWWYQNDDGSYFASSWQWIDGKCYYFDQNGYCLINTVTPDGYYVDESGAWIVDGVVQTAGETAGSETGTDALGIFAQSAGTYYFSSGAGGWGTALTLNADGSFEGSYHDSDMGSSGSGYVATVYYSEFQGRFKNPVAVNDYSYRMELDGEVAVDRSKGDYIEDEVRYRLADPYGMEVGHEFYLYQPGAPMSALPEDFINWIRMHAGKSSGDLPFYGIYNVEGGYGFAGEK